MATKSAILLGLIDALAQEHDKYSDGHDKAPNAAFWHALDAVRGAFRGEVPNDCQLLANAVSELDSQTSKFDTGEVPSDGEGTPGYSFWDALERVRKIRQGEAEQKYQPPPVEPIAELMDPAKYKHMSTEQVAKMWNLRYDDGRPGWAIHKVALELANPGCCTTKDPKWVHPHKQTELDNDATSSAQSLEQLATDRHDGEPLEIDDWTDAPESIEELLLTLDSEGKPPSDQQIIAMKRCSPEQLAEAKRRLNASKEQQGNRQQDKRQKQTA